jgi:hypothetical protein
VVVSGVTPVPLTFITYLGLPATGADERDPAAPNQAGPAMDGVNAPRPGSHRTRSYW